MCLSLLCCSGGSRLKAAAQIRSVVVVIRDARVIKPDAPFDFPHGSEPLQRCQAVLLEVRRQHLGVSQLACSDTDTDERFRPRRRRK